MTDHAKNKLFLRKVKFRKQIIVSAIGSVKIQRYIHRIAVTSYLLVLNGTYCVFERYTLRRDLMDTEIALESKHKIKHSQQIMKFQKGPKIHKPSESTIQVKLLTVPTQSIQDKHPRGQYTYKWKSRQNRKDIG